MKDNGDFLKDRLSPGKCAKCLKTKIITVSFGSTSDCKERICKQCLDAISDEIGERIVAELGTVEEPQKMCITKDEEIVIQERLQQQAEQSLIDAVPGEPPKKKRGRPPKPLPAVSGLSAAEIEESAAGARPSEGLGVMREPEKPDGSVQAGWGKA